MYLTLKQGGTLPLKEYRLVSDYFSECQNGFEMRQNKCVPVHVLQLAISDDIHDDQISGFYVFVSRNNTVTVRKSPNTRSFCKQIS